MYPERRVGFLFCGFSSSPLPLCVCSARSRAFSSAHAPQVVTSDATLSGLRFPLFSPSTLPYTTSRRCRYLNPKAGMSFRRHATTSRARRATRGSRTKAVRSLSRLIKRLRSCIPRVSGSSSLRPSRHDAAASGIPGMRAPSLVPRGRARRCDKQRRV